MKTFKVIREVHEKKNTYLIDYIITRDELDNMLFQNEVVRNEGVISYDMITTDSKLLKGFLYQGIFEKIDLNLNESDGFIETFYSGYYFEVHSTTTVKISPSAFATIADWLEAYDKDYTEDIQVDCDIDRVTFNSFRVYNVGQGLGNTFGNRYYQNIFDLGSHTCSKSVVNNMKNFKNGSVKSIFISHSHSDHYNLIEFRNYPNLTYLFVPLDALVLTKDLITLIASIPKGIIIFGVRNSPIGHRISSLRFKNGMINLHFGKATTRNNKGLLLYFELDDEINKFFTGDASFEILKKVKNQYLSSHENVVAPHHGGNVGKTKINNLIGNVAILSYYPGYYRNVPKSFTMNQFLKQGFTLNHTCCIKTGDYYSL